MPVRLASQEEPLPGYKLLERLGRGGFGEVWKVEAPGGLHKAMKFVFGDLDSADDDGKPAEQELKALNRVKSIRHPYILSLERFDIIDGQLIIVMELADRNLWDRFRECRAVGLAGIPRDELLRYLYEAAEALDLMNNQYQIQHLDIKPQNIFLLYNHVKVADFGLAKDFEGARGTMTGGVTPVYAAPETFEGYLSRFTDQYSLAIVFQELLTGTRPFVGSNTKQLLLQHLNSPPELSAVPEADRPILERGLAKNPNDRWPSCSEMIRALSGSNATAVSLAGKPASPTVATSSPAASGGNNGLLSERNTSPTKVSPAGSAWLEDPPTPAIPAAIRNTPLPSLITPRLVTPQAAAGPTPTGPAITLQRPQVFQTARMSSLGIAPPEKIGDGVLFPALVIGIGQTGLTVLQGLRRLIQDRFGSPDAVPTVRFLYIDTDPEATASATRGPGALANHDVVLARLNRPAHYLQQDTLPSVEQWLAEGILYQLPKNPGPAVGIRPFGRLALCDHFRLIAQRVRQEIETFLTDEPLDRTAEQTRLGVRSNRPRAYLIANLAGGTGSGMLLDLAYIVKHELRAVGYRKPDTVGVVLTPTVEPTSARTPAIANTFAALAELDHFGNGNRYSTRFDTKEAPITDNDGPFSRMALTALPRSGKERDVERVLGGVSANLFLEILTTAGPCTDQVRNDCTGTTIGTVELTGIYRMTWPRSELLAAATRRFSQRLLQRWTSKDAAHLREPIGSWLTEQWEKRQLDWPTVQRRLDEAIQDSLGDSSANVISSIVDAIRTNTPTGARVDMTVAVDVLEQLLKLVGKPGPNPDLPGTLPTVIADKRSQLVTEADTSMAAIAVSFLEQPQYRLAGAEEALAQVAAKLRITVDELEPRRQSLSRSLVEGYARLLQQLSTLKSGWKSSAVADLADHLRIFPEKKLELAKIEAGLGLYRTLLNNIPEYRQEVNFCRKRFEELHAGLSGTTESAPVLGPGTVLLPAGCANLDDAADKFLGGLAPEEILSFDQQLQKLVRKRFRGLVNVCLKPERSFEFLTLLTDEARAFLDSGLAHADPAGVFWQYSPNPEDAEAALTKAVSGANPSPVPPAGVVESVILAVPTGPEGDRLRDTVMSACPDVAFVAAPLCEEIVVYRTAPRVPLAAIPQFGEVAREAYQAQADRPLHTRTDVNWSG